MKTKKKEATKQATENKFTIVVGCYYVGKQVKEGVLPSQNRIKFDCHISTPPRDSPVLSKSWATLAFISHRSHSGRDGIIIICKPGVYVSVVVLPSIQDTFIIA